MFDTFVLWRIRKLRNLLLMRKRLKLTDTVIESIKISEDLEIGSNCRIAKKVKIAEHVKIGDFTYLNADVNWIIIDSNVSLGKFCSVAPGVSIALGGHEVSYVSTHPILFDTVYEQRLNWPGGTIKKRGLKDINKKTSIGNDVWIGAGAFIRRGIQVGDGAVIAAGAIVTKNVPEFSIVGGNPARILKYRTTPDNIKFYRQYKNDWWWNQPVDWLRDHISLLYDFDTYISYLHGVNTTAEDELQKELWT